MNTLSKMKKLHTAQKMKFSIKDFFGILLKKSLTENFIFCEMAELYINLSLFSPGSFQPLTILENFTVYVPPCTKMYTTTIFITWK